jgi:hypothetical protein
VPAWHEEAVERAVQGCYPGITIRREVNLKRKEQCSKIKLSCAGARQTTAQTGKLSRSCYLFGPWGNGRPTPDLPGQAVKSHNIRSDFMGARPQNVVFDWTSSPSPNPNHQSSDHVLLISMFLVSSIKLAAQMKRLRKMACDIVVARNIRWPML